MTFFQEYALLIAVAIPVLAIVGINVYLAWTGEVDTLLLPFLRDYPKIGVSSSDGKTAPAVAETIVESAMEEPLRKAA